jgi:2-polyprenyl-3-methyl-5-hydroxy-6-metoxy-1,4-benzoquinol methylase
MTDPTGWFEELYLKAEAGEAQVPWDKEAPNPGLVDWGPPDGAGLRALVVGSGLGNDAEFVAGRGYDTTAFDVAPTAIATTKRRFPDSKVNYLVAHRGLRRPRRHVARAVGG